MSHGLRRKFRGFKVDKEENVTHLQFLSNEVVSNGYMLCPLMEHLVLCQHNGRLIIDYQFGPFRQKRVKFTK